MKPSSKTNARLQNGWHGRPARTGRRPAGRNGAARRIFEAERPDGATSPFRPAGRRRIQASGRCHPANGKTPRLAAAFTLIEIMVVVIILGILAATIIPQFMGTTQDAKISAAKSQVAELESAVERLYVQMDRYPTAEEGLKILVDPPANDDDKKWRGPYIKQLRNDPWGHPYQYACPGTHHPTSFDIWSAGGDSKVEIGNW